MGLTGIVRFRKNRTWMTTTRSIALSLALCAMVLRALLPEGWMPAAAAAGAPFVICSVDGSHHGGRAPADQRPHAPCAFAAAAPLSPPSTATAVVRTFDDVTVIAYRSAVPRLAEASDYRPNAARAPPAAV